MKAFIISKHILSAIPSASGVEAVNGFIYIIGDDSPWLYILNQQAEFISKTPLFTVASLAEGRIAKKDKPDFESMTVLHINNQSKLMIAGSGSLSPQRDTAYLIDTKPPYTHQMVSLTTMYDKLRLIQEVVGAGKLNIEGMAAGSDKFFMVQRGNITGKNMLISYDLDTFCHFINGETTYLPPPEIFAYTLPVLAGKQSGFSGITHIPGTNALLVTASVEDTTDEIADGLILGSFTGIIYPDTQKFVYVPVTESGKIYTGKIESITVLQHSAENHTIQAIAVTDNDAGSSEMLFLQIEY